MTATFIHSNTKDAVATLTIDRPEKLNALTNAIMTEFAATLDRIAVDDSIRVVVLTGEGRAFSAGFDVSTDADTPEWTPAYWVEHFRLAYAGLERLWALPQPVVAKIRGAFLGGGFALSLACDLAYARRCLLRRAGSKIRRQHHVSASRLGAATAPLQGVAAN